MILRELLDRPYPYRWIDRGKEDQRAEADIQDDTLMINFALTDSKRLEWEINFTTYNNISRKDAHRATGAGDEYRIFSTVVAAIKDWYESQVEAGRPPGEIFFSADKTLGRDDGGGRVRLYDRFAKQFAQKTGMSVTRHNARMSVYWTLTRENIQNEAGVGRITKQNTTQDVKPGETRRQAAKFGSKLNKKNEPPLLNARARKNTTPHVLDNLGLTESTYPIADRDEWYGDLQYKEQGARMVMMSPDEYLSKVRPLKMDDESVEDIDILAQHIQDGGTLDPLKIYPNGQEDGRHRAHAAKKLGIKKVPVIVWPQKKTESKKNRTVAEDIRTIRRSKGEKFGHKLENYEPEGKIIARMKNYQFWFTDDHSVIGYPTVSIYDPKNETVAAIMILNDPSILKYQTGYPDDNTYIISTSVVHDDYSGQGLVYKSYVKLIKSGYNLVSDDIQTEGGTRIWQKLAKTPGVHVYGVTLSRDSEPEFSSIDPDDIGDANFQIFKDDEHEIIELEDQLIKLRKQETELEEWLEDTDIDREQGHEVEDYDSHLDNLKAIRVEIRGIQQELEVMRKHKEKGKYSRLMATADKPVRNENINERLKKVKGKWALVSKSNPKKVLQYYDGPKGQKPSQEWVRKVERRVHAFESRKLNELFDDIYDWQWGRETTRVATASFKTQDGGTVDVFFERLHPDSPNYEVGFKKNGETKRSGEGDQYRIIATVVDVIRDFIRKNPETEVITFVAKREGRELLSRDIKNRRAELYRRMLGRYAERMGFEFADEEIGRMTEFTLVKKRDEGLNESFALDPNRWNDKLAKWLEIVQDKMEDVNNATMRFSHGTPQYDKLEKDYRALHAIENVIFNHQKAIKLQRPGHHFLYNMTDDGYTALHVVVDGEVAEIKWLGSYNNSGMATKLMNNLKSLLKREGVQQVKLTAKWGSEGFYERLNFKRDSETRDDPVGDTTYTDMSKDIDEQVKFIKPDPKNTLGVKRNDMPQIHKDHYPELIEYLRTHGGEFRKKTVKAKSLKPVQSEFSDTGIEKMMRRAKDDGGTSLKKPLIVSSDNYIIDGHHRWLAALNLGVSVPVMQFSIPIKKLFKLVKEFPHTTYKKIYETRFDKHLTEALSDPYPYTSVRNEPQIKSAIFTTQDSSKVKVVFAAVDEQDFRNLESYTNLDFESLDITGNEIWEFFFKRNTRTDLTNQGDQFKIFATIVEIFRDMVAKTKPKIVMFSASKDFAAGSRRGNLYSRLARMFAQESGYSTYQVDTPDEDYFVLTAPGFEPNRVSNVMEQACIQGGHTYEGELSEIASLEPLRNDQINIERMPQRLKQISQGEFKKIQSFGDHDLYFSNDLMSSGDGYAVIADKNLKLIISLLRLQATGNKTIKAGMAWTHPDFRRKGFVMKLYDALLDRGFNIQADDEQTQASQEVWKRLVKRHTAFLIQNGEIVAPINNLTDLKKAYRGQNPRDRGVLIQSPKNKLNENMSVTGTAKHREEREKNLQPGTEAWFKHWFSRPFLTREEVDRLKKDFISEYTRLKGAQNEKEAKKRRPSRN